MESPPTFSGSPTAVGVLRKRGPEKSGPSSGVIGLRGLLEGRFGAEEPVGKQIVLGWTQRVYIITHRKAEKLIPGNFIFEGETHGFETSQSKGFSKR